MKKAIKLIVMLLFAVAMATMSSCSKEDSYQRKIVGKWKLIHEYGVNDEGNHFEHTYEDGEKTWVFNSDGGCSFPINGGSNVNGTYVITNNTLMISYLLSYSFEIQELTNTTMILHLSFFSEKTYEFRKK